MKQLKKDLNALSKTLGQLTRKTEQIAKRLDKVEKAQTAKARKKAVKKKVPKKMRKATAIDTVFSIVRKSRKGVNTTTLKKETGFDEKKVWNMINILKRQGKVKSAGRGVYVTEK